ncbi:MAG: diphthine--ammonia ligase [Candidatus Caldatribacteriaceae bacterium]
MVQDERGKRVFVSFSGGKDSHLSLLKARQSGFQVEALLTMLSDQGDFTAGHRLPLAFLRRQAEAMGISLFYEHTSWEEYERHFLSMLRRFREMGIEGGIFGDIDLWPHREWVETMCARADLTPYLPLWGKDRQEVAREIIESGFEAYIVVVKDQFLPPSFLGRRYDHGLVAELLALGVDVCAEEGEFHTVVVNGPVYRYPVHYSFGEVIEEEGYHLLRVG